MTGDAVVVRRSTSGDQVRLAEMFTAYLGSYARTSPAGEVERYLYARLERGDSRIWIAERAGALVGFAQVYDEFSSLQLRHRYELNDLYVEESARGSGAGRALLDGVVAAAVADGADGVVLETRPTNAVARALYESAGFTTAGGGGEFLVYELSVARC